MLLGLIMVIQLSASEPPETTCDVAVEGLPASARAEHEVVWPGGRASIGEVVTVRFRGRSTPIAVRGPRYAGHGRLDAAECSGIVVPLLASPRPARIEFRCAPEGLVVKCTGCRGGPTHWTIARQFPDVPMDGHRLEVRLDFKAAGFQGRSMRAILYPGVNLLDVKLERLS
jgi:hypothetical protein